MKKKRKSRFPAVYLAVILVLMYLPILVTVFYSFNESKISSIWGGFSLRWYEELFRDHDLFEALGNTIVLALISCGLATVIGTLGAWGMHRRGSRRFDALIASASRLPIMIPEIILGMVFLAVFSFMGLPFGMLTLVIAHTSFCIPYLFIMVSARLAGMDRSVFEAAQDLGASQTRAFFDIIVPQILPAVFSGLILSFAMSIDDVVISIFTTGPTVSLLPVKIYTRIKTGVTPEINALATLMILIAVILIVLSEIVNKRTLKEVSK